jgi:hypothetical protein
MANGLDLKARTSVGKIIFIGSFNIDPLTVSNEELDQAYCLANNLHALNTGEHSFKSAFCGTWVSDIRITGILMGKEQEKKGLAAPIISLPPFDRLEFRSSGRVSNLSEEMAEELERRDVFKVKQQFASLARTEGHRQSNNLDHRLYAMAKEAAERLRECCVIGPEENRLVYADSLLLSLASRFFPYLDPIGHFMHPGKVLAMECDFDKEVTHEKERWLCEFLR